MAEERWKKVTADRARSIVGPGMLEEDSVKLLDENIGPEAFIQALGKAEQWPDAVKVMSRALPARESVWWACVCARQSAALAESEVERTAVEAAEAWVYEPTEKNRELAFEVVKNNDAKGVGSLCALAAAFSAGNAPLGEGQHLDLDPTVFAQLVDGVVMVSATERMGEEIKECLQTFLLSGENIAQGGDGAIMDKAADEGG